MNEKKVSKERITLVERSLADIPETEIEKKHLRLYFWRFKVIKTFCCLKTLSIEDRKIKKYPRLAAID